ncbi:pectinesterase family protein [Fibrobacter sp.]|uniref:pectinesterase family protein n=1 Tax=Fibrobacter sp. TaxID=35828 RepID=UPI0025BB3257|nr:pectinesterase family protein [Fibrobacter sp.]MBR2307757.1 T9SS type A sorting domain-containing protein [Fibrobacter sp.]MBR4006875.1 T9SS type A sorting domain-containing protein [Fibrobacter sp.]
MQNNWTSKFLLATLAFTVSASAVEKKKIDFVVGVDGDFKAAMNAAKSAGASESSHYVIFFPDGEYNIGSLTGDSNQMTTFTASNTSLVGQSADKTVLYNKSINEGISVTATLKVSANGVYMQDITLYNKANYGNENNCGSACRHDALMTVGDKLVYKNVKLLSTQDTYYTKLNGGKGRSYWEGGQIEGTVDFICGDGDVFFEGTNLVMRRSGGYITASQNNTEWGYVFNNATITVTNNSFNGTFYLGRSWGTARTVFLNTRMIAQPTAEGWQKNMNSAPKVFGEYNSKDGNGNPVNTSKRRTYFDGSKDGSTATLKTVWDANDAAKYTLQHVLKGSDNWDPTKLTAQVSAPKIAQEGAEITWADDNNARAWVIFVNGKYKANVITPSFSLEGVAVGSKITVRAANSMGGLGAYSNEVTTIDANATYYKVTLGEAIGGMVSTNLSGDKVMEGKTATFTATPNSGWKFAGWSGKSAAGIDASKPQASITAAGDIELTPSFAGDGSGKFQAEEGAIENGINESSNAGFAGAGYVNFNAGTSSVQVPVYADVEGEYKLTLTYANGSKSTRSLSIKGEAGESQEVAFEATESWTTYVTKEVSITLPQGASTITFATVGGNDGPNLDQLELAAVNVVVPPDSDSTTAIGRLVAPRLEYTSSTNVRLFSTTGKLLRESTGAAISTNGLPRGIYIMQVRDGSHNMQKTIRVK